MKRNVLLSLVFGMLLFTTCTTDFDLTSEYREIIVVYGILDPTAAEQYIRIHRAFLDEETSALVIAENPDSIYYGEGVLDVTLTNDAGQSYTLQRVAGDTIPGIGPKEGGTFANSPNILYRLQQPLNPNTSYTLNIQNTLTGVTANATTSMVDDFQVLRPFPGQPVSMISDVSPFEVIWNTPENAAVYDLYIRLHYEIADISNPGLVIESDSIIWKVAEARDVVGNQQKLTITNENFYQNVQRLLDPDPDEVRYFDHLEFIFRVGNTELGNYIDFINAQSGLLSNSVTTQYTNVDNGLGIFASKFSKTVTDIPITPGSLDTLACGQVTGDLGFAPSANLLVYPNYPFCN